MPTERDKELRHLEEALRAVWEHRVTAARCADTTLWMAHSADVSRIFAEVLENGQETA